MQAPGPGLPRSMQSCTCSLGNTRVAPWHRPSVSGTTHLPGRTGTGLHVGTRALGRPRRPTTRPLWLVASDPPFPGPVRSTTRDLRSPPPGPQVRATRPDEHGTCQSAHALVALGTHHAPSSHSGGSAASAAVGSAVLRVAVRRTEGAAGGVRTRGQPGAAGDCRAGGSPRLLAEYRRAEHRERGRAATVGAGMRGRDHAAKAAVPGLARHPRDRPDGREGAAAAQLRH